MAKYRKLPVVVEAEQFFYDPHTVTPQEIASWPVDVHGEVSRDTGDFYACIQTLEGCMVISPGDWIITGIAGERYPCKPDIFAATYEAVAS